MGWLNGVFVLGVGVGIATGTALATNMGSPTVAITPWLATA